jgi:hypothetical protein
MSATPEPKCNLWQFVIQLFFKNKIVSRHLDGDSKVEDPNGRVCHKNIWVRGEVRDATSISSKTVSLTFGKP